jgi:uncharacterized membrane protein
VSHDPSSADPGSDGPAVVALRADRQDIRRIARSERRAGALWPVPALFGVAALVGAIAMVALDSHFDFHVQHQRFLVGDTSTALTLTSVVATGMLAFLGIVFATTLVAIQLAASQYSPRAVRVFIRSRLTKVSLGIFVATFVFSMVTLVAIRAADKRQGSFTPVLSSTGVILLVFATVIAFLVFANGTARLLRVQYLVERIADDTRPALLHAFPSGDAASRARRPGTRASGVAVASRVHGVVDAVDVGDLANLAAEIDGWIEVTTPIGSYVGTDSTIAVVYGQPSDVERLSARVLECMLLTNERTLLQDPGFGLRQLVDIAIRALSPAVNDPTTGSQVVDRITELLGRVVDRPDPTGWYADAAGVARVLVPPDTFASLATLGFGEIIRYGADSPQVVRRIRAAIDTLEARASAESHATLEAVRQLLDEAVDESLPRAFLVLAADPDPRGLG